MHFNRGDENDSQVVGNAYISLEVPSCFTFLPRAREGRLELKAYRLISAGAEQALVLDVETSV